MQMTKEIKEALYLDFEGQSPFWEVEHKGKKHYFVWDGKNNVSIMIKNLYSTPETPSGNADFPPLGVKPS